MQAFFTAALLTTWATSSFLSTFFTNFITKRYVYFNTQKTVSLSLVASTELALTQGAADRQ